MTVTDTDTGEGDTRTAYLTAVNPTVITYTYDGLNRLTGAEYSTGERYEYAYDSVGNRTAMTTTLGATTVTTYTYDAANRLTKVDDVAYTWDDRGNLISDGTFDYAYDAAGRLSRAKPRELVQAKNLTNTLVYTYNGEGLRVAQSVDGDATTFVWDLAVPLAQVLRTSDGARYVHGLDLIAEHRDSAWAYPLGDALGSVRQWTDSDGVVDFSRGYTPFGVEVDGWTDGSTNSNWGYTGEWSDPYANHSDLLYLRARWYQPYLNRFTSPDTIIPDYRNPQSINPYVYVQNNPINYTDPTGHFWYDPINDRWIFNGVPYPEAPVRPRIEFQDVPGSFRTREDALDWVMAKSQRIESQASQYGIPPELVAGILAVEIANDFNERDVAIDTIAKLCYAPLTHGGIPGCFCDWYANQFYPRAGIGVGLGQIHTNRPEYDWWAVVQHYQEQGYLLPAWATYPEPTLLTNEGSIEGVAVVARALADARTGNYSRHASDLTLDDMAMIFVGYRFGVGGFTDVPDSVPFRSRLAFEMYTPGDLSDSPRGNFEFARPYYEAFQFYFEHIDLYRAEYGQ